MNEARLEIFADDRDSPPQLLRSLPAALDGLVDYKAFQEFADQFDEWLKLLDAEHERLKNRYWWTQYAFYTTYPAMFFLSSNLFMAWCCICVIYVLSVRLYTTYCRKSPKSIDEIIKEIRSLCEVMTSSTLHVSFHPMVRPFPTGSRQMDFVEYIYISISDRAFPEVLIAFAAAVINIDKNNTSDATGQIGNASVATPCDYQLLEAV